MHYSESKHRERSILYRVLLVGVLAWTTHTPRALADPSESQRSVARELGTVGMEAYFDRDFARAADNLDRAYRLFPTPTLGLWSGRAWQQLGQWVRAAERLREAEYASAAIGDNDAQRQAQSDAATELAALTPHIPRLSVVVQGAPSAQVTLTVDDKPFEQKLIGIEHPVDPGHHRIVGEFKAQRIEREVDLQPDASEDVQVVFEVEPQVASPEPVAPIVIEPKRIELLPETAKPSDQSRVFRVASIVAFSLGGASLATSLITTLFATSKLDACSQRGNDYYCLDSQADEYETFRGAATATFYAGAGLAGAGLVLWFVQPSADKPQQVSVAAKPLGAELSIKF